MTKRGIISIAVGAILLLSIAAFELRAQERKFFSLELQDNTILIVGGEPCISTTLDRMGFLGGSHGGVGGIQHVCWRPTSDTQNIIVFFDDGDVMSYPTRLFRPVEFN